MQSNFKKYILLIISVCLILIAIIIITVLSIIKNEDNIINTEDYYEEEYEDEQDNEFSKVEDRNTFFKVEDCIKKYYQYLDIDSYEEDDEEYIPGAEESLALIEGITSDEERNDYIINLLNNKFIEKNNITNKNLYNFVKPIDLDKYTVQVVKEYVRTNKNVKNYYVIAKIVDNNNYEIIDDVYYIVNTNIEDELFNIYPLNGQLDDMNDFVDDDKIEAKGNNVIVTNLIKDGEMALKYFSDFKMNAMNKTEYAFNLLDEEYRGKRFNNDKNKFDNFIDKNKQEMSLITITQYLVNDYDGYKEYVCKDKYENTYIFKETGIMEYSVKLDNYTIETDKFKEEYQNADSQYKVTMNVDKWIQMINNRDYTSAYNMLDETFRNNNFNGDEAVFEEYMRNKYPLHYKVSNVKYEKENGNVYSQQISLTNIETNEESGEEINIIMKLKEGTDFVMSFSM